jgi:hypothetical protein
MCFKAKPLTCAGQTNLRGAFDPCLEAPLVTIDQGNRAESQEADRVSNRLGYLRSVGGGWEVWGGLDAGFGWWASVVLAMADFGSFLGLP